MHAVETPPGVSLKTDCGKDAESVGSTREDLTASMNRLKMCRVCSGSSWMWGESIADCLR